jgi:hypothetical protein
MQHKRSSWATDNYTSAKELPEPHRKGLHPYLTFKAMIMHDKTKEKVLVIATGSESIKKP